MRRRDMLVAAIATAIAPGAHAGVSPVVLELFTSQACSSCPPADTLLGKLAQRPGVIALAWHVDYWDNPAGWNDRFASREATAREQAYARQLGTEVFTPALVVDGARLVIGSNHASIERAIEAATPLSVSVTWDRTQDGIAANVGAGAGQGRALRVIYDPEHTTDVGAGENEGARLREYRVVRQVDVLGEWDGTARRFSMKPASPAQGQVILVQAPDLRILGASDLPPLQNGNNAA